MHDILQIKQKYYEIGNEYQVQRYRFQSMTISQAWGIKCSPELLDLTELSLD